ncbi:MAG TPA: fumarylacetoacetate hydrolase family protein [Bryobacteraceae bacterium]|nr:fumarylacetoacetate hydrolase family protein [Bryobacteraceae bacterium]
MQFVTFERNGSAEPGVILGGNVIGLKGAGFPTLVAIIEGGLPARRQVETWLAKPPADAVVPLKDARLLAPIPSPPKIICVGLNYRDHAIESKMEIPKVPTIFAKFATAVIGPGDPIVLPKLSAKPDYEAELAFVIGKGGRYISKDRWQDHVFGYTNLNDVSARDYQMATTQWMMGKTFDTFAPFGPAIVTADEIADPHALDIQMIINGEVLQSSNTSQLIFRIPELIEYLSSVFTLEAGDIVSTGTPSGVGFSRTPPRWLRPGDECVVKISGLGELRNPVRAE